MAYRETSALFRNISSKQSTLKVLSNPTHLLEFGVGEIFLERPVDEVLHLGQFVQSSSGARLDPSEGDRSVFFFSGGDRKQGQEAHHSRPQCPHDDFWKKGVDSVGELSVNQVRLMRMRAYF